jgi:Ser-tRNA(Ala) deacylase AlaX
MIALNRKTRKLYYESPLLSVCSAVVVKVGPTHIELDQTIAYPEGGGQESDQGVLVLSGNRELRFADARKLYGTRPPISDVPDILVDGIIQHEIVESDAGHLASLQEGETVEVHIDCFRRAALSRSHTQGTRLGERAAFLRVSDGECGYNGIPSLIRVRCCFPGTQGF